MSYGFRSISQSGFVQIDDSFQNYSLIESGVALGFIGNTSSAAIQVNNLLTVQIPINAEFWYQEGCGSSTPYNYRVYSLGQTSNSGSQGMVVRNASSQVVFDSRSSSLFVDFASYFSFDASSPQSFTTPSVGYRPYVVASQSRDIVGFVPAGGGIGAFIIAVTFIQNSNLTVTFRNRTVSLIPGVTQFRNAPITKSILLTR